MKRTNIMSRCSRAMAAITLAAALAMTACSTDHLADDDLTAASGGDHPGVTLRLTAPTVTVTSANASTTTAMSRAESEAVTMGSLTVELTDADGNALKGENNKIIGGTFILNGMGPSWTDMTDKYDYTGLYVTGGAGTYRIRAWGEANYGNINMWVTQTGTLTVTEGGEVTVSTGTMTVTDNGDGTGTFALSLQPVSAAVRVKLLADNGAELTTDDHNYYGCAFTGIAACGQIIFKDNATVRYLNSGAYNSTTAAKPSNGVWEQTNGEMVPGTYPAKWKAGIWTGETVADADKNMGSTTELMKIYKRESYFTIGNDGAPTDMTGMKTFTVTAPAGSVTLKPGKITTLTIRVGAASATLESVTVSDLTQGEAISGGGNATETYRTLGQLGTMSAEDIAALPTKWIVTDKDLLAAATWGDDTYDNGYMMLAAMMESYHTQTGNSIDLVLPYATTKIGADAFGNPSGADRYGLKSLTAPNVTGSIGNDAFQSCKSLAAVSLPNATDSIGNYAFYNCTSLTAVSLPNAKGSIGEGAFYYCTSLATVNLPKVTGSIGEGAFYRCTSLTAVSLPKVTENIGDHAFYGCTSLTTVNLPKVTGGIGNSAFESCTSLTTVSLPGVTGSIGKYAFYGCTSLTALTIGGEITAWGAYVLGGSTLTSNIALTLSANQKAVASGGKNPDDPATFSDTDLYSASTDYTGSSKRFAGYTFKSITLK